MHRLAPALLALAATLAACSKLGTSEDADELQPAAKGLDLDKRKIRHRAEKTFPSDGESYQLLRLEYGETQECDAFGACTYSTYCGFVVDGKHYPLEVHWVTEADALFDPAEHCDGGDLEGCELPGQRLAILHDEDFTAWVYETDPEDDVLAECFADYW